MVTQPSQTFVCFSTFYHCSLPDSMISIVFFLPTIRFVCFDKPLPINFTVACPFRSKTPRIWFHCSTKRSPIIKKASRACISIEKTWRTCFFPVRNPFVRCWRVNTQSPCSLAEPLPLTRASPLFTALPLGRSTPHTPHTRLSKRRMWRNM